MSPISSVPNVISLKWSFFTLGTWLLIWNCILLLGQILILRKKFKPIQLLQIPLSVLFGWFTDFGLWLAGFIPANFYPVRLLLVVAGTALLGFGIALSVIANVIMNSGEAFVKAIADETKFAFGNVKIVFDVTNVVLALLISLLLFRGEVVGMREGTVIAALCTGVFVKFFQKRLQKPLNKLLATA